MTEKNTKIARGSLFLKTLPGLLLLWAAFTCIRAVDPNRQHIQVLSFAATCFAAVGIMAVARFRSLLGDYTIGLFMGLSGLLIYGIIGSVL